MCLPGRGWTVRVGPARARCYRRRAIRTTSLQASGKGGLTEEGDGSAVPFLLDSTPPPPAYFNTLAYPSPSRGRGRGEGADDASGACTPLLAAVDGLHDAPRVRIRAMSESDRTASNRKANERPKEVARLPCKRASTECDPSLTHQADDRSHDQES